MTDKDFVKSMYPTADCRSHIGEEAVIYVIFDYDTQGREYMMAYSIESEDDAWKQLASTFRNKMVNILSKGEECR